MTEDEKVDWLITAPAPSDAESMAQLQAKSWRRTYARLGDSQRNAGVNHDADAYITPERIELRMQAILQSSVNTDEEFYKIAKHGLEIIGLIYGEQTPVRQELRVLYVDEPYYGSGLAQALMHEFIQWCDPKRPIELGVITDNERAQRFYRKLGFKAIPGSEHVFTDYMNEIIMERPAEEKADEV